MNFTAETLFASAQLGFLAAGLILLWHFVISPSARAKKESSALPPWDAPPTDFIFFMMCVLLSAFMLVLGVGLAARALGISGDTATVLASAAMQCGMLGGAVFAPVNRGQYSIPMPALRVLVSGLVAFLASYPLIAAAMKLGEYLVQVSGLPADRQDSIGMFARADSWGLLSLMIAGAVAVAPFNEEVVFRAGIFRYLRTRIPRWVALTAPALVFASLHVNWKTFAGLGSLPPLVVLAVLFSLAYERTGHIGTPIVAHALFNLNTVIGIVSGAMKQP